MTNISMLDRYKKADTLLAPALHAAMLNRTVEPMWGDDGSFIYRRQTAPETTEFVRVAPEQRVREAAFDHVRMAEALARLLGEAVKADRLPITYCRQAAGGLRLTLAAGGTAMVDADYGIERVSTPADTLASPAADRELFRRGDDLWVRELASGAERALTDDGEPWFAWGKGPDVNYVHIPLKREGRSLPPALTLFSPSGRHVLAVRLDERGYTDFPFYEGLPEGGGPPVVHSIKMPLQDTAPVDTHQARVFDLAAGSAHVVTLSERQHRSLAKENLAGITWSADEFHFWFHTAEGQLIEVSWPDDRQREVYADDDPQWEANPFIYRQPLVRVLPASGEFIWFSMEDGWAHLYLRDLTTGALKNRITEGPIVVGDLLAVNEARREILFIAGCGEDGHNPLWRKLYRAGLDGGGQRLLTPEPVDHEMPATVIDYYKLIFHRDAPTLTALAPSGEFFVDHMSTIDTPPRIVLRDQHGAIVMDLERTDISGLLELGYQIPHPVHVRSEDGRADLWGAVSLPADPLDPQSIPIIELIYAGYQVAWQPTCFLGPEQGASAFGAAAMFNALGFAAVTLDGRGTPGRDREFRRWIVGHGATTRGLEDHVWFIRSLKAAFPALDLERVGVAGGSFGGYNAAKATLQFPEFFKVCISNAGVHHPPFSHQGHWRWHLGKEYERASPELLDWSVIPLASRLAGRMLIMIGNLDENVPINHSFALIRELMRLGKRFDMKLWPDTNHYGATPYVRMIYWDYFVEHLLGEPLPQAYTPPGSAVDDPALVG